MLYKFELLSNEKVKTIPRSTRSYWRQQQFTNLIGLNMSYLTDDEVALLEAKLIKVSKLLKAFRLYAGLLKVILLSQKNYLQDIDQYKSGFISVIDRLKSQDFPLKRICFHLGISAKKYHFWKRFQNACRFSVREICFRRHPNQLTLQEVNTIKDYNSKFKGEYLNSIYYRMQRDHKAFMALSTYYLYCRLLGIKRFIKRKKPQKKGIRATRPFEILHMDVTILPLANNTKAYIYILMDNFSKFILSARASLQYSAKECKANIIDAMNHPEIQFPKKGVSRLICDGGSENKGEVDIYLNQSPYQILKQVASDINFSNSMIEAFNKRIKYQFLYRKDYRDIDHLNDDLPKIIQTTNFEVPIGSLHGLIPFEVLLQNKTPDKNLFAPQIRQAQKDRILANQNFGCEVRCQEE